MKKITFLILILLLPPVSFSADEVGNCGMSTVYMRPYSKQECDQIKKKEAQYRKKRKEREKANAFQASIRTFTKDLDKNRREHDEYWARKYGTRGYRKVRDEKLTSKLKKKFEQTFGKHEEYWGSKRDRERKTLVWEVYGAAHQRYGSLYSTLEMWYNDNERHVFDYMVNYKKGHKNIDKYLEWRKRHPFDPVLWTDLCYEELKKYADKGKTDLYCKPKGGKEVNFYPGGLPPIKRFIYTYGEDL